MLLAVELEDRKIEAPVLSTYKDVDLLSSVFQKALPEPKEGWQPLKTSAYVFGVTSTKVTVCVRVSAFRPVLFYPTSNATLVERKLNEALRLRDEFVVSVRVVHKKRGFGFYPKSADEPTEHALIKVCEVTFPSVMSMKRAAKLDLLGLPSPWETRVDPISSFLERSGIGPSSWVRFRGAPVPVPPEEKLTHCTLEFAVKHGNDLVHVEKNEIAPFLCAAYDIETYSSTGGFPDATREGDCVTMISTSFWRVGEPKESQYTVVQTFGNCDPLPEVDEDGQRQVLESYPTELALLEAWRDLLTVHADADLILGYNTFGFDNEFLIERARKSLAFHYHSRFITHRCTPRIRSLESAALGQNKMQPLDSKGRIEFDLFLSIKASEKLPLYGLGPVSTHFLGEKKEDMPYQRLFECTRPGAPAAEMLEAAVYCAQDTKLLNRLMIHLHTIATLFEMSRVCGTLVLQLNLRGQAIKTLNQLSRKGHAAGHVLNTPPRRANAGKFKGATVLAPEVGFHTQPVAVLDFASLYPSIMLAHNLCPSTFVPDDSPRMEGVTYETHEVAPGKSYTFATNVKGILPELLKDILAARKRAKKEMAAATNASDKAIFNGRQLALKVSANSAYGFFGAEETGPFPFSALCECVTFRGRSMIDLTARLSVEYFLPWESKVVYGDTDSCFVKILTKGLTPAQVFEKGLEVGKKVTKQLVEPNELEQEKVYLPLNLMGKKCYCGKLYEPNKKNEVVFKYIDAKGCELVRRDNAPIVKTAYGGAVETLMHEMDAAKAVDIVVETLHKVVADALPVDDYVITKSVKKTESYAEPDRMEVVNLGRKISSRGGQPPQSGDRVPFVITCGKERLVAQRVDCPDYVRYNPTIAKIDRSYYISNKLLNPILKFFGPFTEELALLKKAFHDAATRCKQQQTGQRRIESFFTAAEVGGEESGGGEGDASDDEEDGAFVASDEDDVDLAPPPAPPAPPPAPSAPPPAPPAPPPFVGRNLMGRKKQRK